MTYVGQHHTSVFFNVEEADEFELVGLVTMPNDTNNDVYALHTDKKTRQARFLTNVTMPLKQQIRVYEADAKPIDEVHPIREVD